MLDADLDANPTPRQPLGGFDPWARTIYRPGADAVCETCGTTFRTSIGNAPTAHACSDRCRMAAWRKRQREGPNRPLEKVPVELWKYRRNYQPKLEDECSQARASAS